jgi:hypothetical protein
MSLRHKVEIYVPINTTLQRAAMNETHRKFILEFGGATVNTVLGGWQNDGLLIMDEIGIIYSYVNKITPAVKKLIKEEAIRVRKKLNEDAITVVIDGVCDFY